MQVFAFVSVEDFGRVILLFLATFVAYVIWDLLRVREYWSDSGNRTVILKRCGVSVAFVVMLYLVWVLYPYMSAQSLLVGALWLAMLILLILYRAFKWKYTQRDFSLSTRNTLGEALSNLHGQDLVGNALPNYPLFSCMRNRGSMWGY